MTNAETATAIVLAIQAVATTGCEGAAFDAIRGAKRDVLRSVYRQLTGASYKGMTAAQLREALESTTGEFYNAFQDAIEEAAPAPEKKARKPRGSKYTTLLQAVMDEHADSDGVAIVSASTLLEMGFAQSTVKYHADWHHSLPCGKAAGALGLVGRLSTKGDENTVTLRRVA